MFPPLSKKSADFSDVYAILAHNRNICNVFSNHTNGNFQKNKYNM